MERQQIKFSALIGPHGELFSAQNPHVSEDGWPKLKKPTETPIQKFYHRLEKRAKINH